MAISPLKSDEIAFEHPHFVVEASVMLPTPARNCFDHPTKCKNRNLGSRALAGAFALGLAACSHAPATVPALAPEPMVAGGWRAADSAGEAVQAAAQYAAGHAPAGHGPLKDVISAQTQVVAGTNISMVLRLADGSSWQAIVWQHLDGTFALTEMRPLP